MKDDISIDGILNEAGLWMRFKSGDHEALKVLYTRYYPVLYGYGCKLYGDTNTADDSIQELFLKLWKNRENLGEVAAVKPYLFKAYRRIALDQLKQNRISAAEVDERDLDVVLSVEDMLISKEIDEDIKNRLRNALGLLTKRQKEIIYLRFYEGLSYDEIETIVQVNYQTIRNCVYEAIKVLKKDLLTISFTVIKSVENLL